VTAPLRRFLLQVEYDGTRFAGLQRQLHTEETVQGALEAAARHLGSTDPDFIASGRTDSGVHALGQVVALNLPAKLETRRVGLAFHALLPDDIRIRRVVDCPEGFSPRFDAIQRVYHYRMVSMKFPNPLERHMVARIPFRLDADLVHEATALFPGRWELKEWRSSTCQAKRTHLNIDLASAEAPNQDRAHWRLTFAARSFLHHQVRFMVGGIVAVACGRLKLEELRDALAGGYRPGVVAMQPACGLCLAQVNFPADKNPFAEPTDESGSQS